MKIVFLTGMPNAGKDTQAEILAKKINARVVTTSREILDPFFKKYKRRRITIHGITFDIADERRRRVDGRVNSGVFVGHLIVQALKRFVMRGKNTVFAGAPRNIDQVREILRFFEGRTDKPSRKARSASYTFLIIVIDEKEAIRRGKLRNRKDGLDSPSIIKKRFKVFRRETLPAIRLLKRKKLLITVSGKGSITQVARRIQKTLGSRR